MKVEWSEFATERVSDIAVYISHDNSLAAERWVEKIFARTARLGTFPRSARRVPEAARDDVREVLFGAYRVIVKLEAKRVLVLTVRHARQQLPLEELALDDER